MKVNVPTIIPVSLLLTTVTCHGNMLFMVKTFEGQRIMVLINGEPHETTILNGVQRFVGNTVIEAFYDDAYENFDSWLKNRNNGIETTKPYDLNIVWDDFRAGKHSLENVIEFYTLTSSSVSSFCEVFDRYNVEVVNPLWE